MLKWFTGSIILTEKGGISHLTGVFKPLVERHKHGIKRKQN